MKSMANKQISKAYLAVLVVAIAGEAKKDGSSRVHRQAPRSSEVLEHEEELFNSMLFQLSTGSLDYGSEPPVATPSPTAAPTESTCEELLWSDDFNGNELDASVWSFDVGTGSGGWGNNELQYYSENNVRVEDGNLVISVRDYDDDFDFTSGRIKTQDKLEVLYGNIEARIKLPSSIADGLWPAFWTLGGNHREVGWPASSETDILEMGSADAITSGAIHQRVTSATHWEHEGSPATYSVSADANTNLNDGQFHVFRLEWTSTRITTFVDDTQVIDMDISEGACSSCYGFHQPHFLILNVAVGGIFTGIFDAAGITAPIPAEMIIDYVRVCNNGETRLSGSVIEDPTEYSFACGLPDSCTMSALNNYAGDAKCGDRIQFLMDTGLSEDNACEQVGVMEFPEQCGVCAQQEDLIQIDCGVPESCTSEVLSTDAAGYSCGDRIQYLAGTGLSEKEACTAVAVDEFPDQCQGCNPSPWAFNCGVPETCTDAVLGADAGGYSCGDRIEFLINSGQTLFAACDTVASTEFPSQCGGCAPPGWSLDCGVPDSCTREVLGADAEGFPCGDRIQYLMTSLGQSEEDACEQVASEEFPDQCGGCTPSQWSFNCGVPESCTQDVLSADADGFPCGDRIGYLISSGVLEGNACYMVAYTEFPNQCGGCTPQEWSAAWSFNCGVPESCTREVLATDTAGVPCGDRIQYLMNSMGQSEEDACKQVAGVEFSDQCGGCTPRTWPFDCGLPETCTNNALAADTAGVPCGDRIQYLINSMGQSEEDACKQVAGVEFPSQCGGCAPLGWPFDCGAPETCTSEILGADADGFACGDRIAFLISTGLSEEEACDQIAALEFPEVCGGCMPDEGA